MATSAEMIRVTDLCKHYYNGKLKALDGVSYTICKGDVTVVIGPSGSGKSTFLRCLNMLEIPTSGSVIFDGTDITQKYVTGTVRVKFYKGTCTVVGRKSDYSLYSLALATYDEGDQFDHAAAAGFIQLHALTAKVWAANRRNANGE